MNLLDVPIQKAEVRTKMGRIYPLAELQKLVGQRTRVGELRVNPVSSKISLDELTRVRLEYASHEVSNFRMVGDCLVADVRLLDTPCGKILQEHREGVTFALRGMANIAEDGHVSNYQFITVDAVAS